MGDCAHPDLHERVRAEQIRMVYSQSPTTTGGSLVGGAFLVAVMWNVVSHTTLFAWGAALLIHQAFRIYSYRRYIAANPDVSGSRTWGRLYILATTIAGCIWGSAGILFYAPEAMVAQVYLCLILFAIAAMTMPALSMFAPAYYPLVVLLLLPFIVRSIASGDAEHIALAVPLVIVLVMSITFGRRINHWFDESIRRRFEIQSVNEMTERARLEAERSLEMTERARLEAERSSRAKSEFLATMSHELRTPLNAIIGYSELMTQHPARFATESAKDPLERILRAGRHLLNLINELLDMAKIEAGKTSFLYEDVDVAALVRDVVETTRSLAEQNGNVVRVVSPVALAPLHTDPKRLMQVVLNLLSNACKFTERGQVDVSIVPVQADGRKWVDVAVTDTGPGMTREQQERLFEDFFQGDGATQRKFGGTGLGLAISRRICQAMGGNLTVTSEFGRGSTFTARLPEHPAPSPDRAPIKPEPALPVVPKKLFAHKPGIILIIDDDSEARELIVDRVTRLGFETATAEDGLDGLHRARELHPAAITLDIAMPGLNGWSVLAAMKEDPELCAIPVVILAAFGSELKRGFSLGAAACLTKPVDYGLLADTLNHLTGRSGPSPVT